MLIQLLEVMHEKVEEGEKWLTFRGERYTLRADREDPTVVELHANDGRGLVFSGSQGQISSQLSPSDIEHLNRIDQQIEQYLAREGQRQVDCCVPVLARYLKWLGRYRDENANRLVEFDPDLQTLTYRSIAHPEDFLVAQRTQGGWQYVDGKLTPEREKAIAVDLERSLRQKEKDKDKERNRGFGR
jgi:hypothetical protein